MSKQQSAARAVNVPSPELITRIRALIAAHGVAQAARLAGVSRQTFLAICAGVEVHRGSIALVSSRVPALQLPSNPPPHAA